MLAPRLFAAPAETPVTLVEAKAYLRIEHADEDAIITELIAAATQHLDGWSGILGRGLITQTWDAFYDGADADGFLRIPLKPVQSISTFSYYDSNGDLQTSFTSYALLHDARSPYLGLSTSTGWPSVYGRADAMTVRFVIGYGAAAAVPAPLKVAIKKHVGWLYENREFAEQPEKNSDYNELIRPYVSQYPD